MRLFTTQSQKGNFPYLQGKIPLTKGGFLAKRQKGKFTVSIFTSSRYPETEIPLHDLGKEVAVKNDTRQKKQRNFPSANEGVRGKFFFFLFKKKKKKNTLGGGGGGGGKKKKPTPPKPLGLGITGGGKSPGSHCQEESSQKQTRPQKERNE